jgi:hypothetical protein
VGVGDGGVVPVLDIVGITVADGVALKWSLG